MTEKEARSQWWLFRIIAGILAMVSLALLVLAGQLTPADAGYGTHEQLGMSPCGFLERTDYPCPTCGMTTAFTFVVHGKLPAAFATQPAGALLAVLCVFLAIGGAYVALVDRDYSGLIFYLDQHLVKILYLMLGVLLAGWGLKCLMVYFGAAAG